MGTLESARLSSRIILDAQTQLALQALAEPYLGRPVRKKLCRAGGAILTDQCPGRDILISDFTGPQHLAIPMIALGVSVDGVPDQGLIFGRRKADGSIYGIPANDE